MQLDGVIESNQKDRGDLMSEVRLQLKKAIPIIVVTWILSLTTTLAFVYIVIPNIFPPTWKEVATLSGTLQERDAEVTDSFSIPSNHWRLHWRVECDDPPSDDVEFFFLVGYSEYAPWILGQTFESRKVTLEDFRAPKALGFEWLTSERGTEYITGSGEFAMRVVGARIEWEIQVEAYY